MILGVARPAQVLQVVPVRLAVLVRLARVHLAALVLQLVQARLAVLQVVPVHLAVQAEQLHACQRL